MKKILAILIICLIVTALWLVINGLLKTQDSPVISSSSDELIIDQNIEVESRLKEEISSEVAEALKRESEVKEAKRLVSLARAEVRQKQQAANLPIKRLPTTSGGSLLGGIVGQHNKKFGFNKKFTKKPNPQIVKQKTKASKAVGIANNNFKKAKNKLDITSRSLEEIQKKVQTKKDLLERYKSYVIRLSTESIYKIPGPPKTLWVSISDSSQNLTVPDNFVTDTKNIQSIGEYAKVIAIAPAFTIKESETKCISIDPKGTEVTFELTPKDHGTFSVSAKVEFYKSIDCSGTPVPKTSSVLNVQVQVDNIKFMEIKGSELWTIFWAKLLDFWGAVIALIFSLILFLFRKKLKSLFGFTES